MQHHQEKTAGTSEANTQPFTAFSILLQTCNGAWCFARVFLLHPNPPLLLPLYSYPSPPAGAKARGGTTDDSHPPDLLVGLALLKLRVPLY